MLVKVAFTSFAIEPGGDTPLAVLKETGGTRMLPIPISPLEVGAISLETLKVIPDKPLTIHVLKNLLEKLGATLTRVIFFPVNDRSLMARLEITAGGRVHRIPCKSCDAIALGMRCGAPLFVRESAFADQSPAPDGLNGEKLRSHVAAIDTMEFGSLFLE